MKKAIQHLLKIAKEDLIVPTVDDGLAHLLMGCFEICFTERNILELFLGGRLLWIDDDDLDFLLLLDLCDLLFLLFARLFELIALFPALHEGFSKVIAFVGELTELKSRVIHEVFFVVEYDVFGMVEVTKFGVQPVAEEVEARVVGDGVVVLGSHGALS